MRVIVNDIAASSGGAITVLKDFYDAVNNYEEEHEWIFLLGNNYIEETDRVRVLTFPHVKKSHLSRIMFDFFKGKRIINDLKPDVVFSLQNTVIWGIRTRQVLYVHQPLPFQRDKRFSLLKKKERSLAFVQYFVGIIIKASIKKASNVIVQTNWMKEEVIKRCRIDINKVEAIMPYVNFCPHCLQRQFDNKKFFYPTSTAAYKNISCIEKAAKILERKGVECSIELTTEEKYCSRLMSGVGRLKHQEVEQKYYESTLVFPSYIETFGYPLAEAKRAGTIVLASNCSFSREILEDYPNAYFFDYDDSNTLSVLIEKVIKKKITRQKCFAKTANSNSWYTVIRRIVSN